MTRSRVSPGMSRIAHDTLARAFRIVRMTKGSVSCALPHSQDTPRHAPLRFLLAA